MSFGCLQFLPKNKRYQVDLIYHSIKVKSFVRFFEEMSAWKNNFDYVWPLHYCVLSKFFLKQTLICQIKFVKSKRVWRLLNKTYIFSLFYTLSKSSLPPKGGIMSFSGRFISNKSCGNLSNFSTPRVSIVHGTSSWKGHGKKTKLTLY